MINEMERQLNKRAQAAFGELVANPHGGSARVRLTEKKKRDAMCTPERMARLDTLIGRTRLNGTGQKNALLPRT
ncbi:hypothetical protein [Archangium primigenium]|uniref:hypothetical protein n=1 Tax=[Archangium] primigenium TaxID=2792470 RepID=UPI00195E4B58|nr:hypothetical protein [Archangium primigenium]MBM7116827.1 hypothetical protein [Archangium primigenium]